jgi:2,3-bisphosphoglycerate-independent phosphoglycerate mutase
MFDYSAGHISTEEAKQLIGALDDKLGNEWCHFYPGISYRHICKLKGQEETLLANCTPPHDIPGKLIAGFLPQGQGSEVLRDLMQRSKAVLQDHSLNLKRSQRGDVPVSMIWLFWGSGQVPDMPSFQEVYHLRATLTSGVDLLHGLAQMARIDSLNIPGVTDLLDNDYAAQTTGALKALQDHDLAVIHIEATDEAGHAAAIEEKIEAINRIDREVLSRLRSWQGDGLRVLIMPDHPTPIKTQTHSPEPVPFLLWGVGFTANGASRFSEAEAARTGLFIDPGYNMMKRLTNH